jgi:hypothetical protein
VIAEKDEVAEPRSDSRGRDGVVLMRIPWKTGSTRRQGKAPATPCID